MNILKSIAKIFKDNKEKKSLSNDTISLNSTIDYMFPYEILSINPNVYLCNRAARLSVGKEALDTEEGRLKHIKALVDKGHESVLEHSNIVACISISMNEVSSVEIAVSLSALSNCKYLNVITKYNTKGNIQLLIGGSIRGYIHFLRETVDAEGMIYQSIKQIVYESIQKEFLSSLINQEILDEQNCSYIGELGLTTSTVNSDNGDLEVCGSLKADPECKNGLHCNLLYAQPFIDVYKKVSDYGFTIFDVLQVCTISFLFHDISRATGNQLVRHRVGITQESQRYVLQNTDKSSFIDPIKRHRDDRDGKYDKLDEGVLSYIDKRNPFSTYKYLINKSVAKEDARMWLPLGVQTKIMITFTYQQLFKFLDLRLAKSAQYEIRGLANECKDHFIEKFHISNEIYDFLFSYSIMPASIRFGKVPYTEYKTIVSMLSETTIEDIVDEEEDIFTEIDTTKEVKPKTINTIEEAEQYFIESSKSSDKDAI